MVKIGDPERVGTLLVDPTGTYFSAGRCSRRHGRGCSPNRGPGVAKVLPSG